MVQLTMTPAIVAAIEACRKISSSLLSSEAHGNDPSLKDPRVGNPISHGQIIAISRCLRKHRNSPGAPHMTAAEPPSYHLDDLLRGSKVYIEPSKPKAEPSSEYTALMARLRREEEARAYERLINPPQPVESFSRRFPTAPARLFPASTQADVDQDDEITYADVNRQMALIVNILVSIVACSVAIWLAASHWSTPKRLGLSMGGSGMIGVAEVVVYTGYLRRLKEARDKGKKEVEVKEVIKTWVIGGHEKDPTSQAPKAIKPKDQQGEQVRKRRAGNRRA
ncbi:MAG: hypothetical protein FRX48_04983 [Lasallia pustulata]|uniref:ATPase, vacuolar ER assembly factor, Vma12 n=1 Tax=Lasallia pustulata TaxID=136370 RepID=A0A5M8PRM7_9LECA|nr:MAG: hypothetical protein FRX48_04983 [Lasallia pustulata]